MDLTKLNEGIDYLEHKYYDLAIQVFEGILKKDPGNFYANL